MILCFKVGDNVGNVSYLVSYNRPDEENNDYIFNEIKILSFGNIWSYGWVVWSKLYGRPFFCIRSSDFG